MAESSTEPGDAQGEDTTDSIHVPDSNKFPEGNLEYQFFRISFQMLRNAGVKDAENMWKRFKSSAHSSRGIMKFNGIIAGVEGYSRTLNKLMELLSRIEKEETFVDLYNLCGEIVKLRQRQLAVGMERGDSEQTIVNHSKVLHLWNNHLRHFNLWLTR